MISTKAKITENVMRVINFKAIVRMMAKHPSRSSGQFAPKALTKMFNVTTQTIDSKTVATIEKKNSITKTHVIYLHGGAYVLEANFLHWSFIKKILNKIPCKVSMVDYPLAPEHNYKDTIEMLTKAYEYIIEKYPQDSIVIMGDSAGGGLALAFTQMLIKENRLALPKNLVLLSPWLDLTVENPQMKDYEKQDMILSYGFLQNSADKYADGVDKHNYLLSPINGDLRDLPSTLVLYGSSELFVPDIEKFEQQAIKNGSAIKFVKYEGMQHDWVILPIKETDDAIKEIHDFL